MNETIKVRRVSGGCDVHVTRKSGNNSVHWKVRILDYRPRVVESAIKEARSRLDALEDGINLAKEES